MVGGCALCDEATFVLCVFDDNPDDVCVCVCVCDCDATALMSSFILLNAGDAFDAITPTLNSANEA